jgi:hypothetical protein
MRSSIMPGRRPAKISRQRWQAVWWLKRQGLGVRESAEHLKISPSLVSYYLKKGVPPYSAAYDLRPPKKVMEERDRPKPSGSAVVTPLFRAPR